MVDDSMVDKDDGPETPPRRALPEPPDLARVDELRRRLRTDRRERDGGAAGVRLPGLRQQEEAGRRARDIGAYTIIPMMMFAGPAIGYLVGLGAERLFGAKPWLSLAGMLWGLFAAFRQIYLLLKRRDLKEKRHD